MTPTPLTRTADTAASEIMAWLADALDELASGEIDASSLDVVFHDRCVRLQASAIYPPREAA